MQTPEPTAAAERPEGSSDNAAPLMPFIPERDTPDVWPSATLSGFADAVLLLICAVGWVYLLATDARRDATNSTQQPACTSQQVVAK